MKKRILSILLTLCMVICLVPVSVLADDTALRSIAVQNIGPTEAAVANDLYEKMSLQVSVITLINDIELGGHLSIDYEVTIDLNGHVLKIADDSNDRVIKITKDGHLILTDGRSTVEHKFTPNADGLWVLDEAGGTEIVKGGIITGGNTGGDDGGGVYIEPGGRFTMNGGSIVGCSANDYVGGGVYVSGNGVFEMNDGAAIIGCVAVMGYGGGVYCEGGFTMNGGTIRDCTAFNYSAIDYRGEAQLFLNGTVIAGSKDINGNPNPNITGTTISTVSLPNSKVGDLILGDKADIQADMSISSGTFHANGGVVRGNVHSYRELTFSVDEGVTVSTIIYGQIRGWYITIDGPAVTYQVNGKDYAKQVLRSGMTALKPDDPAAEDGYVFAGWYNSGTVHNFIRPITEDITLTAKWAKLVDKTADFTASDGGAAAIALLNSAKNGAEDSTWDNSTKTLTLKGVSMATTATTAVKLPDGATVILADGTENHIIGGDATVAQDGEYNNKIFVYGIYAAGKLTIQGETNGTGKLFVNSGDNINSGDALVLSIALCMNGDLTFKGGSVTAQGGKASGADGGFSYGVELLKGHSLLVSGGTLIGIGGESFNTEKTDNVKESFSAGIDAYNGDVTVSGSGKLIAETVPSMADGWLSYGLKMMSGSLTVKDSAAFSAAARRSVNIYDGDIILMGGKLSAFTTSEQQDAVSVMGDSLFTAKCNIEISGGTFECVGGIYMSMSSSKDGKGVLSVTDGKLTAEYISGANTFSVSGGTVTSGRINADTVKLSDGSITVREPVRKYPNGSDLMYVSPAIYCENLTVSGGMLDAAWDWGEYAPSVLPADSYWGYAQPLIKVLNGTSSFSGGTVTLDTGCAGNTAIKTEKLNLSGGVRGNGYTNEDGSDTYIQKDGSTPVKFVVYQADYTGVDEAIKKANSLNKDNYKDFSAVKAAINAVVRDKNLDEQAVVDAMAKAIEDAISALEYKGADYTKVVEAIAKANALNKDEYKNFAAVESAIDAVVHGKNITEQTDVDAMAKAIDDAIGALEYKGADYSKVDEAIKKANALNKDDYKDFSGVQAAINAVVRSKDITEQSEVDAMAKAIEDAIGALEKRPADTEPGDKSPQTGDSSNVMLWIALFVISGGVLSVTMIINKRKKRSAR